MKGPRRRRPAGTPRSHPPCLDPTDRAHAEFFLERTDDGLMGWWKRSGGSNAVDAMRWKESAMNNERLLTRDRAYRAGLEGVLLVALLLAAFVLPLAPASSRAAEIIPS